MLLGTDVNQHTYAKETREPPYLPSKPPTFPAVLPITPEFTARILKSVCSGISQNGISTWTLPKHSPVLAPSLSLQSGLYDADGQAKKATAGSKPTSAFNDILHS